MLLIAGALAGCISVGGQGSAAPTVTPSSPPAVTTSEPGTAPTPRPRRSRRPRGTDAPNVTTPPTTAPTAPTAAPPTATAEPQADLVVEVTAPPQVLAGQGFDVAFIIRNDGIGAAGTFHYAASGPGGAGAGEVPGLASGEVFAGTAAFTAPGEEGTVTVTVTVDSDTLIDESAEDNNQASAEIGVLVFELPSFDIPDFPF
jgi:hypothetical protein